MAWRISAQLVETCSCNMLCPCWFGVPELAVPDQGWCAMAFLFAIEEGYAGNVNLDGCVVVVGLDFPGNPYHGNGVGRLYIGQSASVDQQRELEALFSGQRGGPWAVTCSLITAWLPAHVARIEIAEDGDTLVATVDDAGSIQSRLLRDPAGRVTTMQGVGLGCTLEIDTVQLAPSESHWTDPSLPRTFETKSGTRSRYTWSG
jgi:hypothetical protein